MKEIDTYEIIKGDDLSELTRLVNHKLTLGWQPQGGVASIPGALVQAMISSAASRQEAARLRDY